MKEIIHRGITSLLNKDNSYIAIKRALQDKNVYGVEFDIRLTKDNIIVLSHDSIIKLNYIENMNYHDIIKIKHLTTLDKILTIKTNKILLIDIKVNNNYKHFAHILLKTLPQNKNIYLASFNKKIIKYLNNKTPLKKGVLKYKYQKDNYDFIMVNYHGLSNIQANKTNKEIFLWTIHNNNELKEVTKKFSNINNYFIIKDKEE